MIKVTDAKDLGQHIVVQGGTFYNDAVLRAFENLLGADVVRPDIAGIMGAFGAALIARERYHLANEKLKAMKPTEEKDVPLTAYGRVQTTMLPIDDIINLQYTTHMARCQGCNNHCVLTINQFGAGRNFVSGNRCERGLGLGKVPAAKKVEIPNLF